MANRKTFVKVFDDIDDHPAFMMVSTEALGLWVKSLTYCNRNLTDGHFPSRAVGKWHDSDTDAPAQLTEAGRWHLPGHTCEDCPQPAAGFLYVHGYLDVHKSREQVQQESAVRARAGSLGGAARAAKQVAKPEAGNAKQTSSESYPETETETEKSGPRKRATQLPADFTPNDTNRRIAEERGLDLAAVVAQWSDFHTAKGSTFKDWHAALNTWLRREQPSMFPTRQTAPAGPRPATLRQCDGKCPGTRHEWHDARNHYLCQGA